jgi:hypothetical protein
MRVNRHEAALVGSEELAASGFDELDLILEAIAADVGRR